jgi:peptide/nickel transport system substrate-binding protein
MLKLPCTAGLCLLLVSLLALMGCNSSASAIAADEGADAAPENAPFALGDLLDAFTPPKTLAELEREKKIEWVDRPVVDSLELLRKFQDEPGQQPLVSVEEALKLRNDSPEDNQKILSALGRLPNSDSEANYDAEINRHIGGDLNSTNPILASSAIESEVLGLTGFGLFSFDWNFEPFAAADAVATWQTSKDGYFDKVVMRDDLTWSDGEPITAHDIVFSFKAIMTKAVPVHAQRSGTEKIQWIEAYDDHTLVYFHKDPLVTNIWNLNFSIIPKHKYEKSIARDPTLKSSDEHVDVENNPVVGGPYQFKSRTRGSEIVLERRESYYMYKGKQVREKPYFKNVRFRIQTSPTASLFAMQTGDIDEMMLNAEQWRTQTSSSRFYDQATKVYGTEWTEFHFGWNLETPYFSDRRVRQAMSYAFDHREMLDFLRYGLDEACTGNFHQDSKWSPKPAPKPYEQDFDRAEALLDAAGWTDSDGDGIRDKVVNGRKIPFEFTVMVVNVPDRIAICNLLRESLDGIGIRCHVRPLEFTVLVQKTQDKKFQAYFGGWGTGTDPDTSENIWGSKGERNYVSYKNKEVDDLFEQGRKEFDPEKRAEIYQRLSTILWDDQPYTWLFYRTAFYGFNKSVRGFKFSPRGPYSYGPGFSSMWMPVEK